MKLKKIVPVAAVSMMLVSSSFSLNVSAKNSSDTAFEFSVPCPSNSVTYPYARSGFRTKQDRSAPYCYLKEAPTKGFNMRIYTVDDNFNLSTLSDGTTNKAIMYAGQKRLIKCSVIDAKRKHCAIGAKSNGTNGHAKGVWSPDSQGSYLFAN